jgi:single-strand DNA-binding protein
MVTARLRQRSRETPEGDERSVTEIEADEVGASLKWATAKVEVDGVEILAAALHPGQLPRHRRAPPCDWAKTAPVKP